MYFIILCVIIVNELILIRAGWWTETTSLEEFFSGAKRDMGYAIGVPESMSEVAKYIIWMTPKAWRNLPILWEVFPVIIYGGSACLCMSLYWEHEHVRQDILKIINKIKSLRRQEDIDEEEYSQNSGDAE